MLPLPKWMWSSVINLSPNDCLVPSERGDKSEAQCYVLLLACWALRVSYTQIILGESRPWLHPCQHHHFFLSSLERIVVSGEGLTNIHKIGHFLHLLFKLLLCSGFSLVGVHMENKLYLIGEILFPELLVTNFSSHVPSKCLI